MSVQAISWVLDHSKATLGARLVLIAIANHAKADGTGSWPSVAVLAREALLSEREVRYCLRSLEKLGEINTETGSGPYGTNLYSITPMKALQGEGQGLQGEGQGLQGEGAKCSTRGGNLLQGGGQPIAPEPSFNRPKGNRNSFVAPTHQEVSLFMLSKGVEEPAKQAEVFIAHHANRGWRLSGGRGPLMKDWEMAVVTWCANIPKFKPQDKGLDFEEENRRVIRGVFGKRAG